MKVLLRFDSFMCGTAPLAVVDPIGIDNEFIQAAKYHGSGASGTVTKGAGRPILGGFELDSLACEVDQSDEIQHHFFALKTGPFAGFRSL